jgi:nuclear pore complex protein Nup155
MTAGPTRRQLFRAESSSGEQTSQMAATSNNSSGQQLQTQQSQAPPQAPPLQPVQRAARTVNEVLQRDSSFPELDSYVKQGISSDYDVLPPGKDAPWAPFQRSKMYNIPDSVFDQYNHAQVSTMMGLFAELNHAWVAIDNALYLWDYTQTNPELIGFEEQPNSITAVQLVVPRAGVFVPSITHVLVVATTTDILMLGVAASRGPTGITTVSLYQTKMSLSIKGIAVSVIEGSAATGRIFFAGGDNEVYELTYQQEEKWFSSRCAKINHTSPGYTALVPAGPWTAKSKEYVVDMVIDDSRKLLYTLSSQSTIRTFHMDTATSLQKAIEKARQEILRDISHMVSQSPLLDSKMKIISISPISARESSKLHLMAMTSTGCRLFLSATRGYGYLVTTGDAPQSMQVQHIKFPPREAAQSQQRSTSMQLSSYTGGDQPIDVQSRALDQSRRGLRYPPGYFLDFVTNANMNGKDILFVSAPDTGRIVAQSRENPAQGSKYYEQAHWIRLDSRAEAVGLVSRPFAAGSSPMGFGNELAVQFDAQPTEIAILTNTGIHTIRRKRLVDVFAAALHQGGGDAGLEAEIQKFIRQYGRNEVAAACLAVACGQGTDVSTTDARVTKITDKATLDLAQKVFIEYGGKPYVNENTDVAMQAIDRVRPSARHEGLALYITRLIRSLWKAPVVRLVAGPGGAISVVTNVQLPKLRTTQDDVSTLVDFLSKNSTFIEGLTRPEDLQRITSKHEEIALQGEHQALTSLQVLARNIVEGISFVLMLFEERIDEIWASLDDTTRVKLRDLTYESLFASNDGKDLARVLVKAIVNRNIASGSNVDTVADALRRKCASFCSAGDVMIFKAQEQLKRASELGPSTDVGRNLLNGSLQLFLQVADSLSYENLAGTAQQYADMQFYAGAIQLVLTVAKEVDRGNRALSWVTEGKPEGDDRQIFYEKRKRFYDLIHKVLQEVDSIASRHPETIDGRLTVTARKRQEAYTVVNESDDEVFQYDLFDWYLTQGWVDRLLAVQSTYVVKYLEQLSRTSVEHADLLWRFYANSERFYEAATVQLLLAKSDFALDLKKRIEYLSRAKANASTHTIGTGRQARQVLLHEVAELLEVANIQDDILQRLKGDPRIDAERKPQVIKELNGRITDLTEVCRDHSRALETC